MNERIIYTNNDGGISIVMPTGEVSIEQVIAQSVPEGTPYTILDVSDIPEDRTYRDAWELVDGKIAINLDKKNAIELAAQSAKSAKEGAIAKLSAIGLTADEISALGV